MIKPLGRTLPLILTLSGLSLALAQAQTLPWPDAPGTRPGSGPAMGAPAPGPMMAPPMQPQQQPPPDVQAQQKCVMDFMKLRETTEKLAATTRAAGERKVPREEMCKHITTYSASEDKLLAFTKANSTRCGIPPEVLKSLTVAHGHTATAKKNICATASGPGPGAAPTLSDALGTSRMPVPEGSASGRGTLDTLTGNAIAR